MKLNKWNYKTHKYEPYIVSDEWKCKLRCNDLEEKINCPHCGKEIKFGDSYTSLEIHNHIGFGFAVCEKCHNNEILRRMENEE